MALVLSGSSGITLPANPTLSANPNTLDDYEEGTWDCRPSTSMTALSPLAGWTISDYKGNYVKIGALVMCTYYFGWSTTNSSSNSIYVNLPFPVNWSTNDWSGCATETSSVGFPSGVTYVTIRPESGNSYASFKGCGSNTGRIDLAFSNFGAQPSGYALGTFTYMTAA